jgi:DNA modification methylase
MKEVVKIDVKKVKPQPVTQKIEGKRVWLRDEGGHRIYKESEAQRKITDVWTLPIINPVASERLGYPTQKPERLLERIILSATNIGDVVLDCFMGSGTTVALTPNWPSRGES